MRVLKDRDKGYKEMGEVKKKKSQGSGLSGLVQIGCLHMTEGAEMERLSFSKIVEALNATECN